MLNEEEMSILNTNNFYEGVTIIEKHYNQDYGTFDIEGKDGIITLELTTGGWGDNEQLINEIADTMFWVLWWQESKRGGYYKFIYSEKMEVSKSWYLYENDYGRNFKMGNMTVNGEDVDLSTPEKLYDYLIKEMEG